LTVATEAPPPFTVGTCLAPGFQVLEHLRRGSLLDVYDVWSHERSCRCVAKVLRPDRDGEPAARRRLFREGHLLLRLTHPHIVRAYEVLEDPPTIILETLTGATLAYLINATPRGLGAADVAILGLHLVSAVQYLHRRGVLHLDLKPSNIVSERGLTKLLDLDIARPPGRSRGSGTPRYMAPEQLRGGELSPATDVWGIGMVLFEAATGQLPFDLEPDSTLSLWQRGPQPIPADRRFPPPLRRAIMGALEAEPSRRPNLHELAAAFDMLLVEKGPRDDGVQSRPCNHRTVSGLSSGQDG
jgi:eukaryotic-like serine/threonine-protein kinase